MYFCGVPLLLCGCWYHLAPFGLSCHLHLLLVAYRYNNIGKVVFFPLFFHVFWSGKSGIISPVRQPYCVFLASSIASNAGEVIFSACLLYTGILLHLYTNYDQFDVDVITSGIELLQMAPVHIHSRVLRSLSSKGETEIRTNQIYSGSK
jgi:cytochrome b subunit of formate dehydrogenase